jgi:hypothetical protein
MLIEGTFREMIIRGVPAGKSIAARLPLTPADPRFPACGKK